MDNTVTNLIPTSHFLWRNGVLMQSFHVHDGGSGEYLKTDWRPVEVGGKKVIDPIFKTFEQRNGREPQAKRAGWDHVIEFDGGTTNNNPKKGYGAGYGSYQIDGGEIRRVTFGNGHSCNSAEILTLVHALRDLAQTSITGTVLCRGDSKIALKWISHKGAPSDKGSENFIQAIASLRAEVKLFPKVDGEWRRRNHSVALFGH